MLRFDHSGRSRGATTNALLRGGFSPRGPFAGELRRRRRCPRWAIASASCSAVRRARRPRRNWSARRRRRSAAAAAQRRAGRAVSGLSGRRHPRRRFDAADRRAAGPGHRQQRAPLSGHDHPQRARLYAVRRTGECARRHPGTHHRRSRRRAACGRRADPRRRGAGGRAAEDGRDEALSHDGRSRRPGQRVVLLRRRGHGLPGAAAGGGRLLRHLYRLRSRRRARAAAAAKGQGPRTG